MEGRTTRWRHSVVTFATYSRIKAFRHTSSRKHCTPSSERLSDSSSREGCVIRHCEISKALTHCRLSSVFRPQIVDRVDQHSAWQYQTTILSTCKIIRLHICVTCEAFNGSTRLNSHSLHCKVCNGPPSHLSRDLKPKHDAIQALTDLRQKYHHIFNPSSRTMKQFFWQDDLLSVMCFIKEALNSWFFSVLANQGCHFQSMEPACDMTEAATASL